jgi:hypothetical protein
MAEGQAPLYVNFGPQALAFIDVAGLSVPWKAPEGKAKGVYLWCVSYEGAWLVNYVGKAGGSGGLGARLRQEFNEWRAGLYCTPVDLPMFKRGRRTVVPEYQDWKARQFEELSSHYRLLLAPLRTDRECRHVESTIVDRLRRIPATCQFLANRDLHKAYRPATNPRVVIGEQPPIIGLNADVPPGLT